MMCSPATGCNKFFPSRSYADGGADDYVLLDVLDDNSWLIFVEDLLHLKKSVHSSQMIMYMGKIAPFLMLFGSKCLDINSI